MESEGSLLCSQQLAATPILKQMIPVQEAFEFIIHSRMYMYVYVPLI